MKKNNEQQEKVYTTLDAYQSGFLTLRGHTPDLIEQGDKIVFRFSSSEEFLKDLSDYNSGAMVEALKLTHATNHEVPPLNIIVQQGAIFNLNIGDVICEKEHRSIWKKIKEFLEIIERLFLLIGAIIGLLNLLNYLK